MRRQDRRGRASHMAPYCRMRAPRFMTAQQTIKSKPRYWLAGAALAGLVGLTTDAQAELREIASADGWTAHAGLAKNGRPACRIGIIGAERSVFLHWIQGDDNLILALARRSWSIPRGLPVATVVQFDRRSDFVLHGHGGIPQKDYSTFAVKKPQTIRNFIEQFRTAGQMSIATSLAHEPAWTIKDMSGSDAIAAAFSDCIRARAARVPPWADERRVAAVAQARGRAEVARPAEGARSRQEEEARKR